MRRLRVLALRLRTLLRRPRVEDELDAEMRLHVDLLVREALDAGLAPADAEQAARRAFGPVLRVKAQCRDTRRLAWLEDAWRDLRHAARRLVAAPAFTLTAIVSLALGMGVVTAIAGLVDAVLVRGLPVSDPAGLVFVQASGRSGTGGAPPYPAFVRLREETTAFTGLAAFATDQLRVEIDGRLEQLFGQVASGNYFDVLGLAPAAGRLLSDADDRAERPVAVISAAYASRRFGGPAAALGRIVHYRSRPFTIVGVTPPAFSGVQPGQVVDITFPIAVEGPLLTNVDTWWFEIVARLRNGAARDQADAQVNGVFDSFMGAHASPGTVAIREEHFARLVLTPADRGLSGLRTRFATPLMVLTVIAAAVLLVTCLNVATLLLVSVVAREREFAVRLAAGARAGRLTRQLIVESLLLFGCGAAAGLPIAYAVVAALTGFFAVGRSPILLDVRLDWRVAAFAAAVALAAALLSAIGPALRARRAAPLTGVTHGTRLAGSARLAATTRLVTIAQFALSLVLVVSALLFARTMVNLRDADLGFDARDVLTMSLEPEGMDPVSPDAPRGERAAFWAEVLDRVRRLPGVRQASLSILTPLSGRDTARAVSVPGYTPAGPRDATMRINHVSEGYVETLGLELRSGRSLTAADANGPRVAVINEAAVRHFFGGRNALGEPLTFGAAGTWHVVGVIADHRHRNVRDPAPPQALLSAWQPMDRLSRITLSVRADASPTLARDIGDQVRSAYPRTLVSDVLDVQSQVDATLVSERVVASLSVVLATVTLVLAAVGLYGGLSHGVAYRRVELGVRLALGAAPRQLAWSLYRGVLTAIACGAAVGLPLAWWLLARARPLLFGVDIGDLSAYAASVVLLATAGMLAAWGPARRVRGIAPAEALRHG